MLHEKLKDYKIILGSQSPRRQLLLKGLDIPFEVKVKETEENFPPHLKREDIAIYLCKKKAAAFENDIDDKTLLITADTIVWINEHILNKPKDHADGVEILTELSGKMHEVITGVCLKTKNKTSSFYALTKVFFKELSLKEIEYYISNYKPWDKAGAYGAQEWIGYVAIEKIEGSYFNVMGLPTRMLYEELMRF